MIETLRQLCNARGVSGSECAAAALAGKLLSDYAQVSVDKTEMSSAHWEMQMQILPLCWMRIWIRLA